MDLRFPTWLSGSADRRRETVDGNLKRLSRNAAMSLRGHGPKQKGNSREWVPAEQRKLIQSRWKPGGAKGPGDGRANVSLLSRPRALPSVHHPRRLTAYLAHARSAGEADSQPTQGARGRAGDSEGEPELIEVMPSDRKTRMMFAACRALDHL